MNSLPPRVSAVGGERVKPRQPEPLPYTRVVDIDKLRSITNNYQDVRLISLRNWKEAQKIVPRDVGGPYMVCQTGYNPQDLEMTLDEFVLSKSGKWLSLGFFFKLPPETRREEFIFGSASEVMDLLQSLPSDVTVFQPGQTHSPAPQPDVDDLKTAFLAAKQTPGSSPTGNLNPTSTEPSTA